MNQKFQKWNKIKKKVDSCEPAFLNPFVVGTELKNIIDYMDSQDLFSPQNKVEGIPVEQPEKPCEGKDCLNMFRPSGPWGGRRCERCKKEKRPYKDSDSPF